MTYNVKYRRIGSFFWKTIKDVQGDGFVEDKLIRFFILTDESRIEISVVNMEFKFSKERAILIQKNIPQ